MFKVGFSKEASLAHSAVRIAGGSAALVATHGPVERLAKRIPHKGAREAFRILVPSVAAGGGVMLADLARKKIQKEASATSSLKRMVGLKPNAYSKMNQLADKALSHANLPSSLQGSVKGEVRRNRAFHQLERIHRLANK